MSNHYSKQINFKKVLLDCTDNVCNRLKTMIKLILCGQEHALVYLVFNQIVFTNIIFNNYILLRHQSTWHKRTVIKYYDEKYKKWRKIRNTNGFFFGSTKSEGRLVKLLLFDITLHFARYDYRFVLRFSHNTSKYEICNI